MQIGRYVLKDRLGVGGMAEVYRAEIVGLGGFRRPVALKRILPQFSPREDYQKMFIDEARVCASLTHANLVQIFDFDRAPDGSFYLVMELIEGVDLKRLLDALGGPIPAPLALHIGVEVLEGLTYAHEQSVRGESLGLVHRDVTPSNILLSWAGEVKLVDFGLAKARVRLASTQPGIVKGKFAYLAPEQLEGAPLDGRVDIFALGVVLWEMLTGQRLYAAESDAETLKKLLGRIPEPPSTLCQTVPVACDEVGRGPQAPTERPRSAAPHRELVASNRDKRRRGRCGGLFTKHLPPRIAGVGDARHPTKRDGRGIHPGDRRQEVVRSLPADPKFSCVIAAICSREGPIIPRGGRSRADLLQRK
jgi:serine/threonine protein kinase